jgi:hypothetical protein
MTQRLASDVMLELPAMMFVLCSTLVVAKSGDEFQLRQGLLYGLTAAVGIWTKHTVFLGPMLFLYPLLAGRRRWFRSPALWSAVCAILAASIGLLCLASLAGGSYMPRYWVVPPVQQLLLVNARYYVGRTSWFLLPLLLLACGFVMSRRLPAWNKYYGGRPSLYFSWLVSAACVVLAAPIHDERYLFFALPPAVVLVLDSLMFVVRGTTGSRLASIVLAGVAVCFSLINLATNRPSHLSGLSHVANEVHRMGYSRVMYCGAASGSFIFELRAVSGGPAGTVVRCDKLPPASLQPANLEDFARRHGVRAIVLERDKNNSFSPGDSIATYPPSSAILETEWPMSGSEWSGTLLLYRFAGPSPRPEPIPPIQIITFGKTIDRIGQLWPYAHE